MGIILILVGCIVQDSEVSTIEEIKVGGDNMAEEKNLKFAKDAKVDKTANPISQEDLTEGMYWWSDKRTKKENTPDDWVYLDEGTRSAQWADSKELKWLNKT